MTEIKEEPKKEKFINDKELYKLAFDKIPDRYYEYSNDVLAEIYKEAFIEGYKEAVKHYVRD